MAIILLQKFDHAQEERVLGDGAHGVVGNTCWRSTAHPRGVSEEGIQAAIAALVLLVLIWIRYLKWSMYSRRLGRCRFLRSELARNIELSLRAGWGSCSHRRYPRTRGIQRR